MPISAPGKADAHTHRERGFTLVEIIVVLAIVGLTAAVALVAMPDGSGAARGEAERFGARLMAARDAALFEQTEIAAVLESSGYRFERRTAAGWQPVETRAMQPRQLQDIAVATTESPQRIRFDAVGMATPVDVSFTSGTRTVRLSVDAAGNVRIDG